MTTEKNQENEGHFDVHDHPAELTPASETTHDDPDVRGTVFLSIVFLMLMFGFWIMMYLLLLSR